MNDNTRTTLCIALLAASAAPTAHAGGDKVAFPEGFERGVLYGTVDRYDIKQFRELYATRDAVEAVRAGKPIPSGTVLTLVQYKAKLDDKGAPVKGADGRFVKDALVAYTVMEKRTGWGAEYPDTLRNGEWEYQVFTAEKKANEKANLKSCFECHKPHEKADYVISLAALAGRAPAASAAPKSGPGTVNIAGFVFGPDKLAVKAGESVTWTNTDDSPHQISVQGQPLKTGVLQKGDSAALTFKDAGSFAYSCALHPNMKGSVEVTK